MPTYYLSDTDITALQYELLATSAPSSLDEAQGWVCDKKTALASPYKPDTTQPSSTFVSEPSPFGALGYRTQNTLNGAFSAGNWTLSFKVKCNAYYAQAGNIRYRLWRSVNAGGSGATEVSNGWFMSNHIAFTAPNQYVTDTRSRSLGVIVLTNEYLFLELEWYPDTSGGNNLAAVYWVHNEGNAERLDTPTFTPATTNVYVSDSLGLSDVVLRNKPLLKITDSTGLSDAVLRNKPLVAITDSAGLSDVLLRNKPLLPLTDAISLSEIVSVSLSTIIKYVVDSLGLSDAVLRHKSLLPITDSTTLSDVILRNKALTVSDAVSLTDVPRKNWMPQIADAVSLSDAVKALKTLKILDVLGLTDEISVWKLKQVLDAVGLTEALLLNKTVKVTDAVSLAEAVVRNKLLFLLDTVGLSTQLLKLNKSLVVFDAVTLTELVKANKTIFLTDAVTLVDSASMCLISGVTRDDVGVALGGVTLWLFKADTKEFVGEQISDVGGNYKFYVGDTITNYFIVAFLAGSPDRVGTTYRDIKGAGV